MRLRVVAPPAVLATAALLAAASHGCIAGVPIPDGRQTDDDAGLPPPVELDASGGADDVRYELPPPDPHAVLGITPAHGPFAGGSRAVVRGNGFTSAARVFVGASEVAASDVLPLDPSRVQIVVPKGAAGPADVRVQNGDDASTSRTLVGGYVYDAFWADPPTGSTAGGTIVTFHGQSTAWGPGTTVTIGTLPCASVHVDSPTSLSCTTPKQPAGARSVTIASAGSRTTVLDAFTYADSNNGFRGGLSGGALAADLDVLVFDNMTGDPIEGALVFAGDDASAAAIAHTDASGVASIHDDSLAPSRSVSVAAKCHQPVTFVDVPVDTVTAYLDPIRDPACGQGDPPSVGGHGVDGATVTGELVWKTVGEYKKAGWTNVPKPASADEKQTAYVFVVGSDATASFSLPDASAAVTPESPGGVGFGFTLDVRAGNVALYAVAGLENRAVSPPRFSAYAMGVARGISTSPGATTSDVYLDVSIPLDQALTLELVGPVSTNRGPDRLLATVAVQLGNDGYASLPGLSRTAPLPSSPTFELLGAPALSLGLASARYVVSAAAATGPSRSEPLSIVGRVATNDPSRPIVLDAFVDVPRLVAPAEGALWDGRHLEIAPATSGAPVDLRVLHVTSGGGLVTWTVAVPGGRTNVTLPALAAEDANVSDLVPGQVSIGVVAAELDAFAYGALRYRDLDGRGWRAYAKDTFVTHVP